MHKNTFIALAIVVSAVLIYLQLTPTKSSPPKTQEASNDTSSVSPPETRTDETTYNVALNAANATIKSALNNKETAAEINQPISNKNFAPSAPLTVSNGKIVTDDNLRNFFDFYLSVLSSQIGEEQAIRKLITNLSKYPEAERTRILDLLSRYMATNQHINEFMQKNGTKLDSLVVEAKNAGSGREQVANKYYQEERKLLLEQDAVIKKLAGDEVYKLYKPQITRKLQENSESLVIHDPSLRAKDKILKYLALNNASPNQPLNDSTGKNRYLYTVADQSIIGESANLSDSEKQNLRKELFGEEYIKESKYIYQNK